MLMVILGAGASYDSCADWPPGTPGGAGRPPLANHLFSVEYLTLRSRYPHFQDVIPELVPKAGRSVEDALYRLQNEVTKNTKRLQQLTAIRFYLQELLTRETASWLKRLGNFSNYNALLGQIQNHVPENEPVLLVTFNYDTLLESALMQSLGVTFDTVQEYLSPPQFKLFKLHGSVDWARIVTQRPTTMDTTTDAIIANVGRLTVSDEIYTARSIGGSALLYPAIAIPVKDKSDFECPKAHIAQLELEIPKVTKVLTVGWRGMENHFLRMLQKLLTPVSVAVVAGTVGEASETMSQLRKVLNISAETLYTGFSNTLGDRELDGFFSA